MESVSDLISRFIEGESFDSWNPAKSALEKMGASIVPALIMAMTSRSGRFRHRIPMALTSIALDSKDASLRTTVADTLAACVKDRSDDGELRAEAARNLGFRLKDTRAASLFMDAIKDPVPDVRRYSASGLAKICKTSTDASIRATAVRLLIACLGDQDGTVRRYAARALGDICSKLVDVYLKKSAAAALLPLLKDSDKNAAADAAEALGKTGIGGPRIVEGLMQSLSSKHRDERMKAAGSLGAVLSMADTSDSLRQAAIPRLIERLVTL